MRRYGGGHVNEFDSVAAEVFLIFETQNIN